MHEQNSNDDYHDVEVVSPIFYVSEEPNTAFDEIRRVLMAIRNHFRVEVPESAGFHVHVGNGDRAFTTSHTMSLLSILYLFDRQIQVLHPYRTYETNPEASELYHRGPSRCNLGVYLSGDASRSDLFQYDTKPDLVDQILGPSVGLDSDDGQSPEYSQAQHLLHPGIS